MYKTETSPIVERRIVNLISGKDPLMHVAAIDKKFSFGLKIIVCLKKVAKTLKLILNPRIMKNHLAIRRLSQNLLLT